MPNRQHIAINQFSLVDQEFQVETYRRAVGNEESTSLPNCRQYRLPLDEQTDTDDEWHKYWITFEPRKSFDKFNASSTTNAFLTLEYLFRLLTDAAAEAGVEHIPLSRFNREAAFVLDIHKQGKSCIRLSPYFCKATKTFGFLADFWFNMAKGQKLDREVLRLSHTLNSRYRENTDFYTTRYESLQRFVVELYPRLFPLRLPNGHDIRLRTVLQNVDSQLLATKQYVAGGDNVTASQFLALKQNGPYRVVSEPARLCFLYRPQDKPLSHDLYKALRGDTFSTFTGMEKMFQFGLGSEHVFGMAIDGYTHDDIANVCRQIKAEAGETLVVPVMLVPWSREDGDKAYYETKHAFLSAGLPSQYVCTKTIRNRASFKWTVSNIGMAIFAKLGGKPWKVVSKHDDCLIVGIGQSHRRDENNNISKYYAYCVLTDSSGVYEDLRLLSHENSEENYLQRLSKSLIDVFQSHSKTFSRFAIHTPFKLRREEMKAIKQAIESFSTSSTAPVTFAVLKFNVDSRFMGFATNTNSKVPYESTLVPISQNEYLVWFEGLQFHKNTVNRRYAKPVHVEFIYPIRDPRNETDGLSMELKERYLQDSLSLSGANWRGFNAKSRPVSIFYAQLIARYFSEFEQLGLDEFDIENLTPWFL